MKKIILFFLLMFTLTSYSQTLNPPSSVVGVGFGVLKGTTITVDSLDFQDGHTLLLQDNSTLIIKEKVNGQAIFTYGDVGDDIPKDQLVELPQTLDGVPYMDYREATDVNPKIIFEKCIDPSNITFGPYIDVEIPIAPTIVITSPTTILSCLEPEIIISSTVTSENTLTYLWSTGETTPEITVIDVGIYSVIVTDAVNSCPVKSNDIVITRDLTVPIATSSGNVDICNTDTTTLTAYGGDTYLWSTGETTQSITVNPNVTTVYGFTVSNGSCSADGELTVTVYDIPVADAGLDETIYVGETRTLTASGGSSYLWSTGETTETITVQPNVTTTYTVTVTNGNLCSSEAEVTLTVIEPPTAVANAGDDITILLGDNVILTANGSPSSTYLWNTGETTKNITVSPTQHTIYTVTVTEFNSSDTDSVMVRVNQ